MTESTVWSVYLLRNERKALYAGIATDVERRYREHLAGDSRAAKYTRGCAQMELVYQCAIGGRSLASKVESRIKRLKRMEKLEIIERNESRAELLKRLRLEIAAADET